MFETFRAAYGAPDLGQPPRRPWHDGRLIGIDGYAEFTAEFAGASFRDGLYRVHDEQFGPQALALIQEAFPEFAARIGPFGYDWLGRQFAVDFGRMQDDQPEVLLLEPGTGEALQIPATFSTFHNDVLIEQMDAALASSFFEAWSADPRAKLPLGRTQCVGYRVPLFLGGEDEIDNLDVSDIEVYWSICGQLRRGAGDWPPGTSINEITRG